MSTTIRISKRDRERLARLAVKIGAKSLSEALRRALDMAEKQADEFHGNMDALRETLKYVASVGGDVSERVDEELANILKKESE